MWYQRATRVLSLRRFLIIGIVALTALFAVFGNRILQPFAPVCKETIAYAAEVPEALRSQLAALQAAGELYCVTPPEGLRDLDGPIYWGSDGVNSLLFFQAADPSAMSVQRYGFGEDYLPGPRGGPPPVSFRNTAAGRLIYANQAPEGAGYFQLVLGSPADTDYAVDVRLTGPATENQGVTARSFWRDLENVTNFVLRRPAQERGETTVRAAIPVVADSWSQARRRLVAPELADAEGRPDFRVLRSAELTQPTLFQTLNGPLGAGVWMAGVVTGTTPALLLTPRAGGEPIEPDGTAQTWTTSGSPELLASFSFPPLPREALFDARYWHDGRKAATAPPDLTFPVVAP